MSESFNLKNFTILQDRCAMKVGTDGVLLGSWAHGGSRILDIGSGTGLIALMMAQRFPRADVEGVEIDADAASQSEENIALSPYAGRVRILNIPLQSFVPSEPYDCIVTNPPFFVNSLLSPDKSRSVARHANTLSFADIFEFVSEWLSGDGEFSAIVPSEVKEDFLGQAFMKGLFLTRQYGIKTVSRKPVKRYLLAFSKCRKSVFDSEIEVLMGADGQRSEWYANLTKDFYVR